MKFQEVSKIKNTISKHDFYRKALVKLALAVDAPIDIVKVKFNEIKEYYREIIYSNIHTELDYSCSIGYNREEEYQVRERQYDGSYAYVTKTRQLTDWQPYGGHVSKSLAMWSMNEEDQEPDIQSIIDGISEKDFIPCEDNPNVNTKVLEDIKLLCEKNITNNLNLPGDTYKQFLTDAQHSILELVCLKVPYYMASYEYGGNIYTVEGFAAGNISVSVQSPIKEVDDSMKAEAKETKIARNILWLLFSVSVILCFCLNRVPFLWLISVFLYVIAICCHKSCDSTIFDNKKKFLIKSTEEKLKALEEELRQRGYEELDSVERSLFKGLETQIDNSTLKKLSVPLVILGITGLLLLFVLIIISI